MIMRVVPKTPFQHLVTIRCPQEDAVIFLVQGKIVKDKACSVEDGFTGAEVLHGYNNQVGNLTNACIQHFLLTGFPYLTKLLEYLALEFSHFFRFIWPCLACVREQEKCVRKTIQKRNADQQLSIAAYLE